VKTAPAPEPFRLPAPLNQRPWEFAKDQFGPQFTDFLGGAGALIVRVAKDQFLQNRLEFLLSLAVRAPGPGAERF